MAQRKPPRRRSGPAPKDRNRGFAGPAGQPSGRTANLEPDPTQSTARKRDSLWLYGQHAVLAALANPGRRVDRLLITAEARRRLESTLAPLIRDRPDKLAPEQAPPETVASALPEGAVHQGLAMAVRPLEQPDLDTLLRQSDPSAEGDRAVLIVLDQVTDPHNVGAILRSAAAFGACGLVTTRRHAAPESGALAKSASGALERVPYIQVTNLARALEQAKEAGFWCLGLESEAETTLARADLGSRLLLVLGAEGAGLRRLTRESCDILIRLPTRPAMGELNVSNAAAVALYELLGRGQT